MSCSKYTSSMAVLIMIAYLLQLKMCVSWRSPSTHSCVTSYLSAITTTRRRDAVGNSGAVRTSAAIASIRRNNARDPAILRRIGGASGNEQRTAIEFQVCCYALPLLWDTRH